MRAVIAAGLRLAVLMRSAGRPLLASFGFCGLVLRRLRRGLACPIAVAIAIMPMAVPVLIAATTVGLLRPLLAMPDGRLILLPLCLRLALFARSPGRWLMTTVMIRSVSVPALAAWTTVMAPFALAFRAFKPRFRPAKTPDLLELRLSVLGRWGRLRRCSVCRHLCGLR
jgi:hypothetical protein